LKKVTNENKLYKNELKNIIILSLYYKIKKPITRLNEKFKTKILIIYGASNNVND
jgi:hypothetical protein